MLEQAGKRDPEGIGISTFMDAVQYELGENT